MLSYSEIIHSCKLRKIAIAAGSRSEQGTILEWFGKGVREKEGDRGTMRERNGRERFQYWASTRFI